MKCIIIDSQPLAVQALKNFIKKVPFLELAGSFSDAKDALVFLKNTSVDLIFLEIKKPLQAGSPGYSILKQNAMFILMSTNKKFAFDAFEYRAVDFLVKPLLFERVYVAAEKASKIRFPAENTNRIKEQPLLKGGYIFIKEGTRLVRIELDDIYYVMGLKNYVSIFMKSQRIVTLMTMKEIEDTLPLHRFMRVHRSYFVALDKIVSVEKQQIHIKDKIIPIGNIYLPLFMKKLLKISSK